MKKLLLILTSILIGAASPNLLKAQFAGEAYSKRTTLDRQPAPLPVVREADAIWSRTVWRIIDLREKANQQFYYPTKEMQGRSNLVSILLKGIESKIITAFDANLDDEFKAPILYNQVRLQFGDSIKKIKVTDINTGAENESTIKVDIPTQEVKQLEIKEIWYFDKQRSTMQVRILGICPIWVYKKDPKDSTYVKKRLFWVNYPEIRPLLAKKEALNEFNGARSLSFDDLFLT